MCASIMGPFQNILAVYLVIMAIYGNLLKFFAKTPHRTPPQPFRPGPVNGHRGIWTLILERKLCMKALFSNSFILRKLREAQQAILQFEFRIHLMRPSRYSPAAEIASGWPSKNIAQINPDFQRNHKHHFVNADCSKLYGSTGGGSRSIDHCTFTTSHQWRKLQRHFQNFRNHSFPTPSLCRLHLLGSISAGRDLIWRKTDCRSLHLHAACSRSTSGLTSCKSQVPGHTHHPHHVRSRHES